MPVPIALEPVWIREFTPPNLSVLARRLRAHYGVGPASIGSKGDQNHRRGYHRSREWVRKSVWCTNRTYSVTETVGNRRGGDDRWICAMDIGGLPPVELVAMCRRLDEVVRAGRLEKVVEWYGNDDGDNRVDGWNNIADRVATADSSHLWHLHLGFDRGRADEPHDDLFQVLTGTGAGASADYPNSFVEDDMTPEQDRMLRNLDRLASALLGDTDQVTGVNGAQTYPLRIAQRIRALESQVGAIAQGLAALVAHGTDVDTAVILQAIADREADDRERDEQHAAALADVEAEVARIRADRDQLRAALAHYTAAGADLATADDQPTTG